MWFKELQVLHHTQQILYIGAAMPISCFRQSPIYRQCLSKHTRHLLPVWKIIYSEFKGKPESSIWLCTLIYRLLLSIQISEEMRSAFQAYNWCIRIILFLSVCRTTNSVCPFHFRSWSCKIDCPRCLARRWWHLYMSGWKHHRTGIMQCSGHSQRWVSQPAVTTAVMTAILIESSG